MEGSEVPAEIYLQLGERDCLFEDRAGCGWMLALEGLLIPRAGSGCAGSGLRVRAAVCASVRFWLRSSMGSVGAQAKEEGCG